MLYRFAFIFFQFLYSLLWKHTIIGQQVFAKLKQGAIIAPNHHSFFDPPLIRISCPKSRKLYFIAKKELFKNPVLGFIYRYFQALPIEGNPNDKASLKKALQILANQDDLVIFPEGARSHDGKVAAFQKGVGMLAYRLRCPIVPTFITGTFESWPYNCWIPRSLHSSTIVFGEPIFWKTEWDKLNRKECIRTITQEVQNAVLLLEKQYIVD